MQNNNQNINFLNKTLTFLFRTPFGTIAFSSFIIAAVSGIFLALPYDVSNPYDSISLILLTNPAAGLIRNIHYWGAQLFLVFTMLHIYDHLRRSTEKEVKNGIWFRLTISLLLTFFVMLSGFILKGDADGLQAFRIINSLIEKIPYIGKSVSVSILGKEEDFQILYVNHIATATIFLWIIIVEHAKLFWTKTSTFVSSLLIVIFFSFLFTPSLHDGRNPVIKGPWYFLGFQEIFFWLPEPIWIIAAILLLLIVFYLIPKLNVKFSLLIKKILLSIGIFYIILVIVGFFFRGENWQFILPWENPVVTKFSIEPFENLTGVEDSLTNTDIPTILERREGCIICHSGMVGFSVSHNPEAVGCFSCHGGKPFSLIKDVAHKNMRLIPGQMVDAKVSCGAVQCHPGIAERVDKGLMATLSGLISVDRFVFDEEKTPNRQSFVSDIGQSPADKHLRNLCVSCHLGGIKEEVGPINELSRGGGCLACHLNYNDEALTQLHSYQNSENKKETLPKVHPALSLQITNDHCFGCHSRSGRISTNYEGWFETELSPDDIFITESSHRVLMDGRVFQKTNDDIHHSKGMDCIDCHSALEVMGDGNYYLHKEEQVKIQCVDCHLISSPKTISPDSLDGESQKIIQIRKSQRKGFNNLITDNSNYALLNTFISNDNKPFLITKNNNDSLLLKTPLRVCFEDNAHPKLSCNSCHTSWVSQCTGCHTEYESSAAGYDLFDNKTTNGDWIERASNFFADPPSLGVSEKNGNKTIDTFTPGMIISIDKNDGSSIIFKRLYSPISAHTTTRESRSCKSCHNNSVALGYGRGKLIYKKEGKFGKWQFQPDFPLSKHDGLPEDAWIGFLKAGIKPYSTRENTRPFNVEEQMNILTVGSCLNCHKENSEIMKRALINFTILLNQISDSCLLPRWD